VPQLTKDSAEATTEAPAAKRDHVVYLDPRSLVDHPSNPRVDTGSLESLAASIREVGVIQPLILAPVESGGLGVLAGRRRRDAAVLAECETVPCLIRSDLAEGIDAILNSGIENLRRKDLTPVEEGRLYEQLVGFGLSPTAIAKRTGSKQQRVKQHLTVAGSEVASAAGERFEFLTLEHLLVLQEFDGDFEAVRELTTIAKRDPGYFDHKASQLRKDRLLREKLDATTARLTEEGATIIDDPGYSGSGRMTRLRDLVTDKGKDLNETNHKSCEGHVASISPHDPERVTYWCLDPKQYGHTERYASHRTSSSERGDDGKLTEEARTERRRVIENNKAMDAAIPVRRQFVRDLVAQKAVPKGALRFCVADLAQHPESLTPLNDELLAGILGTERGRAAYGRSVGPKAVDQASEARLVQILLAHIAASIESTWTKEAWRSVDPRKAAWLGFLAEQGYRLAEVEQFVIDEAAAQASKRARALTVVRAPADEVTGSEGAVAGEGEGTDPEAS
jgi:ParB family chromosome partitioning protein